MGSFSCTTSTVPIYTLTAANIASLAAADPDDLVVAVTFPPTRSDNGQRVLLDMHWQITTAEPVPSAPTITLAALEPTATQYDVRVTSTAGDTPDIATWYDLRCRYEGVSAWTTYADNLTVATRQHIIEDRDLAQNTICEQRDRNAAGTSPWSASRIIVPPLPIPATDPDTYTADTAARRTQNAAGAACGANQAGAPGYDILKPQFERNEYCSATAAQWEDVTWDADREIVGATIDFVRAGGYTGNNESCQILLRANSTTNTYSAYTDSGTLLSSTINCRFPEVTALDNPGGLATYTVDDVLYAIVSSPGSSTVSILDVSEPRDITIVNTATGLSQLTGTISALTYDDTTLAAVVDTSGDILRFWNVTAGTYNGERVYSPDGANHFRGCDVAIIDDDPYALCADSVRDAMHIIGLANWPDLNAVGTVIHATQYPELDGARDVAAYQVGGHTYAAVTGYDDDGLQIINVTVPNSPSPASYLESTLTAQLSGATAIEIYQVGSSQYAVVGTASDGITIIDVTNPSAPAAVGTAVDSTEFPYLANALSVDIFERGGATYAAVTSASESGLQIIDISEPSDPDPAGTFISTTTAPLDNPAAVGHVTIHGIPYLLATATDSDAVLSIRVGDTITHADTLRRGTNHHLTYSLTDSQIGNLERNTDYSASLSFIGQRDVIESHIEIVESATLRLHTRETPQPIPGLPTLSISTDVANPGDFVFLATLTSVAGTPDTGTHYDVQCFTIGQTPTLIIDRQPIPEDRTVTIPPVSIHANNYYCIWRDVSNTGPGPWSLSAHAQLFAPSVPDVQIAAGLSGGVIVTVEPGSRGTGHFEAHDIRCRDGAETWNQTRILTPTITWNYPLPYGMITECQGRSLTEVGGSVWGDSDVYYLDAEGPTGTTETITSTDEWGIRTDQASGTACPPGTLTQSPRIGAAVDARNSALASGVCRLAVFEFSLTADIGTPTAASLELIDDQTEPVIVRKCTVRGGTVVPTNSFDFYDTMLSYGAELGTDHWCAGGDDPVLALPSAALVGSDPVAGSAYYIVVAWTEQTRGATRDKYDYDSARLVYATITPPGQPSLLISADSPTEVTLTSLPGTAGAEGITHYDARCRVLATDAWATVADGLPIPQDRRLIIDSLNPGDRYECQWRDRTTSTLSSWSASAVTTLPHTLPAQPTLNAVALSPTVSTWTATAGTPEPSSPITTYDLRCHSTPDDPGAWDVIVDDAPIPAARAYAFVNETPGSYRECQWRDHNVQGPGPWSATATLTLGQLPPGAPTVVTDAINSTAAQVVRTAGTPGSQTVTHYDLECRRFVSDSWTVTISGDPLPADDTHTSTGLTPGHRYECRWRDRTADTVSPWSAGEATLLPHLAPGAPTLTAVPASTTTITLSTVAGTPGSQPVINYDVRCNPGADGPPWPHIWLSLPIGSRTNTVNVPTGETWYCQWRDKTDNTASLWSATASASTATAPGAPALAAAIAHDTGNTYDITLTRTAGTPGSQTVTHYDLECRDTGAQIWIIVRNNSALAAKPRGHCVHIATDKRRLRMPLARPDGRHSIPVVLTGHRLRLSRRASRV